MSKEDIKTILEVKAKLARHYKSITFKKGSDKSKPISSTDTLLSKIMLGTLGCVPAYDRYFIGGLKETNMEHLAFNHSSLTELFNFIEGNRSDIEKAQDQIWQNTNYHYPFMKSLIYTSGKLVMIQNNCKE